MRSNLKEPMYSGGEKLTDYYNYLQYINLMVLVQELLYDVFLKWSLYMNEVHRQTPIEF